MDIDQTLTHARRRFDHAAAKRQLQEKYQAKMLFAYRGGMWSAGPELLTLLETCGDQAEVVVLDLYKNPVKIATAELRNLVFERWQEQMTAWLVEYDQVNRQR